MIKITLCVFIVLITLTHGQFGSSMFGDMFRRMSDMKEKMNKGFQDMRNKNMKQQMIDGVAGVTIVSFGNKAFIKQDGVSFECIGTIVPTKPFCRGALERFRTDALTDYCFSERYHEDKDLLCIASSEQTGLNYSQSNGKTACVGSDGKPALLITQLKYRNLCGGLPYEKKYFHYPDKQHPHHVVLPNPDLGCEENSEDVCSFRRN